MVYMDCSVSPLNRHVEREVPIKCQYRQGDVFLVEADDRHSGGPITAEHVAHGRLVLALGEATGHAHVINEPKGRAQLFRRGAWRYLYVREAVQLVHEEHAPVTVEPGTYMVRIQREYVPPEANDAVGARGAWRQVRD